MLGVVFLLSQLSLVELKTFNKTLYTPLKISTSYVQMQKNIVPPIMFCKVLGA